MRGLRNWLSQVAAVTGYGLRSIPQRAVSSAVAVIGIAGVVLVLVFVLSIAQGILRTVERSAAPENAVVLRSGAASEMLSGLTGEQAEIVAEAPGVARGGERAKASAELFLMIELPKRTTGTAANVPLRGVVPAAFEVRERVRVVAGRAFGWGLNEVIVGVGASREFRGLGLGDTIAVGQERWPVVGIFEAGGGISESEVWADAAVLQSAYQRGDTYQAVYAKLESAAAFDRFKRALTGDPRLNVKVVPEAEYHSEQSAMLTGIITGLGSSVAALMALGAIFGAVNTMYTAVSARSREIATLRALGFRAGPVVASVLFESMLLGVAGGLVGGGVAWLFFDGFRTATINWSSFSQITFAFDVSPSLLVLGIVSALVMGLVGGLFPALRAARMPVAAALREG